jgi:hypothetical protein
MQEMSKTLKSLSSNLLERFIDTAYRFSEQHSLNEVNIKMIFFSICSFSHSHFSLITKLKRRNYSWRSERG